MKTNYKKTIVFIITGFLIFTSVAKAAVPVHVVADDVLKEQEEKHQKGASLVRNVSLGAVTAMVLNNVMSTNDGLWVKNWNYQLFDLPKQASQASLDGFFTRFTEVVNAGKIKNEVESLLYDVPSYTLDDISGFSGEQEDVLNASKGGGYDVFLEYLEPQNNDLGIAMLAQDEAIRAANKESILRQTEGVAGQGYLGKIIGDEIVTPAKNVEKIASDTVNSQIERLYNTNNCSEVLVAFGDVASGLIFDEGLYSSSHSASGGALSGLIGGELSDLACSALGGLF